MAPFAIDFNKGIFLLLQCKATCIISIFCLVLPDPFSAGISIPSARNTERFVMSTIAKIGFTIY